ncbi:putative necrosis-inducing factor-domain-containing protein [Coniochaeta sp. 2T2.1]|nr:putative necrosis-inducing factor-domain-containing protein [Coniochaeta sp. 2T2.1]
MYLLNIIAVLTAVIFTTSLGSPVAHLSSRDISYSAAKDSDPLGSTQGSTASASLDAASQLPALSPTTAVDATPVLDFEAEASHSGIWNLCFPSSFEDHTTAESPPTMDCFALANQVLAMGSEGHWTVWFHPYTDLVSYGECTFGVEACCGSGYQFNIGNEDIALAIYKSINKFGTTQKVSAKGSMKCEGRGHESTWPLVTWSIYHTKTLQSRDAPFLPPPNGTNGTNTRTVDAPPAPPKPGPWNLCGISTFENKNSANSPLIDDCLHLADDVLALGNKGYWYVLVKPYKALVHYGTCVFGLEGCCGLDQTFYIGNKDVADIIRDSVQQFGVNGQIGAKGEMGCPSGNNPPTVMWSIYHTKTLVSQDHEAFELLRRDALPPPISDPSPILGLSTTTNEEEVLQELTFTASSSSDKCGPSSFRNQRDNASPSIEDCLRMTANMANAGYWDVMATGRLVHVANSGTCVFSVTAKVIDRGFDEFFFVGNQDIIDLINSSVQKFGSRGKVAAQGEMECISYAGNDHRTHVQWAIYNSDTTLGSNSTANETLPFFLNETLAGRSLVRKSLAPTSLVSSILPAKAAAVDPGRQCDYPNFIPTFQGETSPDSPVAQNCLDLAASLQPDFFWSIDMRDPEMNSTDYHIVATEYTCSFGVNVDSDSSSNFGLSTLYIGAQDIKDAIDIAVQRFAFHGLVGAEGRLLCRADGNYTGKETPVTLHWALLNPEFAMV